MVKLVGTELDFEKRYRLVREIIETLILTLLMFLIIRLAVQNFNIDGHSMEPGLHDTELVIVDKWTYRFHAPARGDVIVFVAPPNPTQDYIKRIIGVPGDVITIQGTTVIVDGKTLNEPYVSPTNQGNPYSSFVNRVVPPNAYFVLGDNRDGSSDSRDWGCVPQQNIIGRAALVYWPLGQNNDGFLPNVSSVFSDIQRSPMNSTNSCPIIGATLSSIESSPLPLSGNLSANMLLVLFMPGAFVACRRRKRVG
jgi:signal peptidase I